MRFISVGSHCVTAFQLQAHGVRGAAMPFDWLTLTPSGLLECLRDDFARMLTGLAVCDTVVGPRCGVRDAYGFMYPHDFRTQRGGAYSERAYLSTPPGSEAAFAETEVGDDDRWVDAGAIAEGWEADAAAVRAKYARRVERFREAMRAASRGGERVVLVYVGGKEAPPIGIPWVRDVLAALRAAYPGVDVRLLLLNTQVHPLDSEQGHWRAAQQNIFWGRNAPCAIPDVLDDAASI